MTTNHEPHNSVYPGARPLSQQEKADADEWLRHRREQDAPGTVDDSTSLYSRTLVARVSQALFVLDDELPMLKPVYDTMARQLLEMVGKDIALTGFALARDGWVPFGTHAESKVDVELHPDVDEAGMPLWERPVELAREFASGEVMSQSDIDRPVDTEHDLSGDEVLARMLALAAEWSPAPRRTSPMTRTANRSPKTGTPPDSQPNSAR